MTMTEDTNDNQDRYRTMGQNAPKPHQKRDRRTAIATSNRDRKNEMKATDRYLSMVSDDYRERMELKNGKPHLHALYAICWKLGFTVNGLKPLRYV